MKTRSVLKIKSYNLATRIARLSQTLAGNQKEDILSKLLLRSGTAVAAVIRQADHSKSKTGFRHKLRVALKEVNETYYWLSVLRDTDYLGEKQFDRLGKTCHDLSVMLLSALCRQKVKL